MPSIVPIKAKKRTFHSSLNKKPMVKNIKTPNSIKSKTECQKIKVDAVKNNIVMQKTEIGIFLYFFSQKQKIPHLIVAKIVPIAPTYELSKK